MYVLDVLCYVISAPDCYSAWGSVQLRVEGLKYPKTKILAGIGTLRGVKGEGADQGTILP